MEYVLGPPVREQNGGCLVRLADDARKCVVFFGTPSMTVDDELDPWGTGFLVSTKDTGGIYLVTARHVIQDKLDCPFAIRFNDKDQGSKNFHVDHAEWQFHPTDETVDVAVLEIDPPEWADWRPAKQPSIMDGFKFKSKDIGPGDIVYTVGLWGNLPGKKRNKPFVHVGHIGMVPEDDKIVVKDWMPGRVDQPVEVEAYLTEGEPLFGASGSPVFVRRSVELRVGTVITDAQARSMAYGSVWLLGLMSDCYFQRVTITGLGARVIPRGVNIVVPSMKINEVLDKDSLKAARAKKASARRRARVALPEKLSAPPANDANPKHREDFTRLLGEAARKPQPED